MKKIWYAVKLEKNDLDVATGSFDYARAEEMRKLFEDSGWKNAFIERYEVDE